METDQWCIIQLGGICSLVENAKRLRNLHTIEKADILIRRLETDTANGVRCVISRKGMTGYGAQYFSVKTKKIPKTALATNSPTMKG